MCSLWRPEKLRVALTDLVLGAGSVRADVGAAQLAHDLLVVLRLRQPAVTGEDELLAHVTVLDLDLCAVPRRAETLVVVPDATLEQLTERQHVLEREDVRLGALERRAVRLRVLQMQSARLAVLAEEDDVDVRVGAGAAHVACLHRDLVGCR